MNAGKGNLLRVESMMKTSLRFVSASLLMAASLSAIGQGMGRENRADMQLIHQLLGDNKKITRKVTKISSGVETLTESTDPKLAALIKSHTLSMQKRMKDGRPIRNWDPLFNELFQNHKKVTMTVVNTKNGVRVIETSKDPYAITLIQWHAEAVNGFVKDGMPGMHKEHPAPPKPGKAPAEFVGMGDGIATCPVTGEPNDKSVSAKIQGRTVYFCCAGCVEKVVKNPKKYLKWAK